MQATAGVLAALAVVMLVARVMLVATAQRAAEMRVVGEAVAKVVVETELESQ